MKSSGIGSVLVANRGEIAVRIIRTLVRMGIRAVAVHSDADAGARHVRDADLAYRLAPGPGGSSPYLSIESIVEAALRAGVDAVHPGYGFLAENADFARACAAVDLVFIGPSADAIELMGDKIRAKRHAMAAGVPVVPGRTDPGMSDADVAAAAHEVGFPVLLKPAAGGGGKGMRVVTEPAGLPEAIAAARREARGAFGDDALFVERYVTHPRHLEVQVLADAHGNVVHLGERECSLQRRHQKIIEEAPAARLDAATRAAMTGHAVELARSCGYLGVGTVEFVAPRDEPGDIHFIEMNTRLQVEHPVTELVTTIGGRRGVDLVEWQVRVAAGERLPFTQEDLGTSGHAVEARICAEDPANGFLPTGGTVLALREGPADPDTRFDSALDPGTVVGSDYDPLLAKLITWAEDRPAALRRLSAGLTRTQVLGVTTNTAYLAALLHDDDVAAGRLDTGLVERFTHDWTPPPEPPAPVLVAAACAAHLAATTNTEFAGPFAAGPFAAGTSAARSPAAGISSAGTSASGIFAAGTSTARTSATGISAAGTSAAGTSAVRNAAAGAAAGRAAAAGTSAAGILAAGTAAAGSAAVRAAPPRITGSRSARPDAHGPWRNPFDRVDGWRLGAAGAVDHAWSTWLLQPPTGATSANAHGPVRVRLRGPLTDPHTGRPTTAEVAVGDELPQPVTAHRAGTTLTLTLDGAPYRYAVAHAAGAWWIADSSGSWEHAGVWELREVDPSDAARGTALTGADAAAAGGQLRAPMPGTVTAVKVSIGDHVTAGQTLIVMEAMKMEHLITAPSDGTVTTLPARPGTPVPLAELLATVTPHPPPPTTPTPTTPTPTTPTPTTPAPSAPDPGAPTPAASAPSAPDTGTPSPTTTPPTTPDPSAPTAAASAASAPNPNAPDPGASKAATPGSGSSAPVPAGPEPTAPEVSGSDSSASASSASESGAPEASASESSALEAVAPEAAADGRPR